jgi:hypothetical protein
MNSGTDHKRRTAVPFDAFYFENLAAAGRSYSSEAAFRHIYETNHWAGEMRSGEGASAPQTAALLRELPKLIRDLNVQVLLDVPCGDFSWMRQLKCQPITYIGGDLLPELVDANRELFGRDQRRFVRLDITRDPLPPADLVLCRDCFVHLSNTDIYSALRNIAASDIKYLLTTTFVDCVQNDDITTGDWRVLNLELPPFGFPPAERLILEHCSEGNGRFADKSLGLWRVADLHRREHGSGGRDLL